MTFQIRVAERVFSVSCCFERTRQNCRNYLCSSDSVEESVVISVKEILHEHFRSCSACELSEDRAQQIEFSLMLRKVCDHLAADGFLMVHSSVVAVNDAAIAFVAPSGVGKSTHSLIWTKQIPDSYIVNGDKPLVHLGEKVTVYGTPWCGKEGFNRNTSVPLRALCFLKRSENNALYRITPHQIMAEFLRQVYIPDDTVGRLRVMAGMDKMLKTLPLFRLDMNNMRDDAFSVSSQMLQQIK